MPGDAALLTPTLSEHVPRDWSARLPWRLSSQIYVAILGGPIAVTLIAALNAGRLRMPGRLRWAIVAIGVAVTLAAVALVASVAWQNWVRVVFQLSGALALAPMFVLQRPYDRVHSVFSPSDDDEEDYDSLWGPGIGAVLLGTVAIAVLVGVLDA